MAAVKSREEKSTEISITKLDTGTAVFSIVGLTPIIFNCPSEKARHELLFPRGKLTGADKAANLKHDPIAEFRNSIYRRKNNEEGPTRLLFPAPGYKKSMSSAALDLPGSVNKAKIGRLTWLDSPYIDIYGIPELHMTMVRMADINRTPDIRTRCIVREWAATVRVNFVRPMLSPITLSNLLSWAGIIVGVGDWRQEKGSASFGQFQIREADDSDFLRICRDGGMAAQDAALNAEVPVCYDQETENLLLWFLEERGKRGKESEAKAEAKAEADAQKEADKAAKAEAKALKEAAKEAAKAAKISKSNGGSEKSPA